MADTQIVPILLNRIRDSLWTTLNVQITDTKEKADVVEVGRFQDDPTKQNIHVAVQGGHLEKPEYMDGIVTLEEMHRIGMYVPAREVGGGQLWWRRGTCQLGCYYIGQGLEESVARTAAYNVWGRLQANIDNIAVSDLSDSFGERALQLQVFAAEFFQGGGPPKDYIWRGRVHWQCLTERTPLP